jgi:hypothetical protein
LLLAIGEDVPYVMRQVGHSDPKVTSAIYAQVMFRGDGERDRLESLVKGSDWARMGTNPDLSLDEEPPASASESENPADSRISLDGRGWFRTSDLSRVKRDRAALLASSAINNGQQLAARGRLLASPDALALFATGGTDVRREDGEPRLRPEAEAPGLRQREKSRGSVDARNRRSQVRIVSGRLSARLALRRRLRRGGRQHMRHRH